MNATLATPQVRCRINNDDAMPLISIRDVTVLESAPGTITNAIFNLSLNAPCGLPVTVDYRAVDGSAVLDADYVLSFGTVVFPAGVTNLTITVPVKGDNLPETNEVFSVYLNNAFNASFSKSSATCTIIDNGLASLDHFAISSVASPVQAGQPFPITISALDAWNRPFTSFSGNVILKAIADLQTFLVGNGKIANPNLLGTSFHDSRTQVIYTTNEVTAAGQITALSLQITNTPGQTLSNWTIRLKHTLLSSYVASSSWESSGWLTVYQRAQTISLLVG